MRGLLLACAFAIGVTGAYAHHSMAGFERTKTITLVGTVKQFKWANPHCWIEMEVPNAKGGVDIWNVEMTAPGILARNVFESGKAIYEISEGGHHDHLICLDCGTVIEFADDVIESRQLHH